MSAAGKVKRNGFCATDSIDSPNREAHTLDHSEIDMKYMVQFRFQPDNKTSALEKFERLGPNQHSGVAFRSAWIGADSNLAFVLVESASEELVSKAADSWKGHGDISIHSVIDIEQY
jgi:hypothetical protein